VKDLFDRLSDNTSELATKLYSTSFSMGTKMLGKKYRRPIYGIYGFVRFADEIVDTFHEYNKPKLLENFKRDTYEAIDEGISLNPILNRFQRVVNEYNIERELIDTFLKSMEMDLAKAEYSKEKFEEYVLGSAEVVGLMCLRIFCDGEDQKYRTLKSPAMRLGAAYQKINFLRDLKADYLGLDRSYFPEVDLEDFSEEDKQKIEQEIESDFKAGLEGIKMLPRPVLFGVYLSYAYFYSLFRKIRKTPARVVMQQRIRISNPAKYGLLISSYVRYLFGRIR
jgi:phytoene/squalene synthetase